MKNEQSREINQPVWFDGKSINEALFCDDFLSRHKIILIGITIGLLFVFFQI